MKRTGTIVIYVLAALAASAVGAVTAVAAAPELGRCVQVAPRTGEFGGHCIIKAAAGRGRYDWLPGPGEKKKFVGSGEATTLETVGKVRIECTASEFNGEYTGAKTAAVTVIFVGCADPAKQLCESNPTKIGEIETLSLEGEIGFIRGGEKPVVGLDLKKSPVMATFECGKLPEVPVVGTVEGSVIGTLKPFDKMTEESMLTYKAVLGKQVPEQFEGGAKDTLTTTLISGLTKTTEESALRANVAVANEEPLEIKAK